MGGDSSITWLCTRSIRKLPCIARQGRVCPQFVWLWDNQELFSGVSLQWTPSHGLAALWASWGSAEAAGLGYLCDLCQQVSERHRVKETMALKAHPHCQEGFWAVSKGTCHPQLPGIKEKKPAKRPGSRLGSHLALPPCTGHHQINGLQGWKTKNRDGTTASVCRSCSPKENRREVIFPALPQCQLLLLIRGLP